MKPLQKIVPKSWRVSPSTHDQAGLQGEHHCEYGHWTWKNLGCCDEHLGDGAIHLTSLLEISVAGLPVGIFNVIKTFERITGIIKWDPFGVGQAWWSFWRGPFALVPSLGWQYNDSTPVLTKVLITSSFGSGIRKSCFASKTQETLFRNQLAPMIILKQTWLDGNIHHFDRYLPAFSMGIFYGELLVESVNTPRCQRFRWRSSSFE